MSSSLSYVSFTQQCTTEHGVKLQLSLHLNKDMKSIFAADWTFWRLLLRFKYFKSILLPICPRFISSLPEEFLLLATEVSAMKGTFVEAYSRNMVVSFNSVVFLVLAALRSSQGGRCQSAMRQFQQGRQLPGKRQDKGDANSQVFHDYFHWSRNAACFACLS